MQNDIESILQSFWAIVYGNGEGGQITPGQEQYPGGENGLPGSGDDSILNAGEEESPLPDVPVILEHHHISRPGAIVL